ncbi:hypothetical protein B0H63DRAFT_527272 [Podospora didyma]|uniref:Uncharacterized protein n=1 Tax=Podospora didyma TaxID=330526 RepID=A0AAE0N6E6_9PEZI|nr:hypothetical protein B0H63DRAFT_527272 [Podospora didyma]
MAGITADAPKGLGRESFSSMYGAGLRPNMKAEPNFASLNFRNHRQYVECNHFRWIAHAWCDDYKTNGKAAKCQPVIDKFEDKEAKCGDYKNIGTPIPFPVHPKQGKGVPKATCMASGATGEAAVTAQASSSPTRPLE